MFTWDSKKAQINFDKHGVSFEEAITIFIDPDGMHFEDLEHSNVELRYKRLAKSSLDNVILVVYTVRRLSNGKETIRIISARKTSKKEREAYFKK